MKTSKIAIIVMMTHRTHLRRLMAFLTSWRRIRSTESITRTEGLRDGYISIRVTIPATIIRVAIVNPLMGPSQNPCNSSPTC